MQNSSILEVVKTHYGITGKLSSLPGELDLNYNLISESGEAYIVKLMRPGCELDLIELQCSTLIHLEQQQLSIDFPKVIQSSSGHAFKKVILEDGKRILWILTWCPGNLLAHFTPQTNDLMFSFGKAIGELSQGLKYFEHPSMKRNHPWMLTEALQSKNLSQYIQGATKAIVEDIFELFEKETLDQLTLLPQSVIHNDANDYNVLVQVDKNGDHNVNGLFDFGDMAFQPTICEVAVALAYAVMGKDHPLRIIGYFLKGYTSLSPLQEEELSILHQLIKTRLAVSIAISSHRQIENPDDPYITISQGPAKEALLKLHQIPAKQAEAFYRQACGFPLTKNIDQVLHFLKTKGIAAHPVIAVDDFKNVLDLSVNSSLLGADPQSIKPDALTQKINHFLAKKNSSYAIGRYCESRRLYAAANFGHSGYPTQEKRTNHLGIDIFCDAGTPVFAPFDATIEIQTVIDLPLDYGGLLILRHETDQGLPFFTLYGHLKPESLKFEIGQKVKAGQEIALLGEPHENGGWPPHLHLQIIIDLIGLGKVFPGVAYQSEIDFWKNLCPNPMLLFDVPDINIYDATVDIQTIITNRKKRLGYNLSLSYQAPLHIVSGYKQFLFDSHAGSFLDLYNNVPHVGHQHPKVVEAIQKQTALLNTNTRYLHENILQYAERLTDKLPDSLEVCYFVNSATEANELAIRMARAYTQRYDMLVVESAYHGHTNTLIDISPYKHNGPGGLGPPEWVHTVPIADDFRGQWKKEHPLAGHFYANEVKEKLDQIAANGKSIAAFIAETYPSVGGQIIPPPGYLKEVYQHVKNHGAICIADEVQTGFGRLGKSFWAFETQGAIPDMIVLGKPIGNGFPLAAVVTTIAIAEAFDNGMEYFSTFGGNPVACAAGLAVLDVIEAENLQENAAILGQQVLDDFKKLKDKHRIIGDVRGEGFYLGIELIRDHKSLEAADLETSYVVNRLKDHRILVGIDGPLHNVIKIRPSMVVNEIDLQYFIETLDGILGESYLKA